MSEFTRMERVMHPQRIEVDPGRDDRSLAFVVHHADLVIVRNNCFLGFELRLRRLDVDRPFLLAKLNYLNPDLLLRSWFLSLFDLWGSYAHLILLVKLFGFLRTCDTFYLLLIFMVLDIRDWDCAILRRLDKKEYFVICALGIFSFFAITIYFNYIFF